MLNWIIKISLKNRLVVCLFALGLICLGVRSPSLLPIDAFPDTTPVQVQINVSAPALSPQEAEQQITIPLELGISGLPGSVAEATISRKRSRAVATSPCAAAACP